MRPRTIIVSTVLTSLLVVSFAPTAPSQAKQTGVITFDRVQVGRPPSRRGRSPIYTDALEAARVRGAWSSPSDGPVGRRDKPVEWREVNAAKNGRFSAGRGGYAFVSFESEHRVVKLLHARGHSVAFVNGRPCPGDPYDTGWVKVPVVVRKGTNRILLRAGRRPFALKLLPLAGTSAGHVAFNPAEVTRPDLRVGVAVDTQGSIIVVNGEEKALRGMSIESKLGDANPVRAPLPVIPALSFRKVPFPIRGPTPGKKGKDRITLRLTGDVERGAPACETTVVLDVVGPHDNFRRTFTSEIDGSVQYYAVNPARPATGDAAASKPSLVFSLHGASVWVKNQVGSYGGRADRVVVAPTNRRPYGFDWEDWGRLDALEVMRDASRRFAHDPSRVYLTGHSMGGHGTWHVGATFPDRFAAIGPSAGWVSFRSYAGGRRSGDAADPIAAMFDRAWSPSDTLKLQKNLTPLGVYVLHGDADRNVPVREARTMKKALAWHPNFGYHEQKDAKHWWDGDPRPGAACVDWPAMFAFFAKCRRPREADVDVIEFTTASPGVSARCHWVTIDCQLEIMKPSRVAVKRDRATKRITAETSNVSRLAFASGGCEGIESIVLDGHALALADAAPDRSGRRWFTRRGEDQWRSAGAPPKARKGALRYGPFREAFRNRMIFVYGTGGSEADRRWARRKARFDAETFWFRGNGAVDVMADVDFEPTGTGDRNVILYGRPDTHRHWAVLLGACPITVKGDRVEIGERTIEGDDLAVVFCRPRVGSDRALIGVVSGTGPSGLRLTETLPYFVSGVAYPDFAVIRASMLERGIEGVAAAGFFGEDWSLEQGVFHVR